MPAVTDVRGQAQKLLDRYGIDAINSPDPIAYVEAYEHEDPTVFLLYAMTLLDGFLRAQAMVREACLSGLVTAHDQLRLNNARQSEALLVLKTQLGTAAKQLNSNRMAALVRDTPLGHPYEEAKAALPTGAAIVKRIEALIVRQGEPS